MAWRGIVWVGVQTQRFEEMARFIEQASGSAPAVAQPGFRLWRLADGGLIELFAQGSKPTFGAGPVVGFLVDDIEDARRDLEAAGGEVVSSYGPNEDGYASLHFRAPDGNIYEVVHDPGRDAG